MSNKFVELNEKEMMEIEGGISGVIVLKTVGGVLAAAGITVGTAFVVCGTVYAVGKTVQYIGDKITK